MKILKWILIGLVLLIAVLALVYALGPKIAEPHYDYNYPDLPSDLDELETMITEREAAISNLMPKAEAQIVWANDSSKEKTEYSVVYLHGFSANQVEGEPLHRDFAKRYGCNLYLPRLSEHGLQDGDSAFLHLTPENYMESAVEAVAVGRQIGKKVILMCTSTGATLGLPIAGHHSEDIAGVIMYSPNIALEDKRGFIATGPWGLQIVRQIVGGKCRGWEPDNDGHRNYWTYWYRVEGVISMTKLLETTMTSETFQALDMPLFAAYFYENEEKKDAVIDVHAIEAMMEEVKTPQEQIRLHPVDSVKHVMTCEHLPYYRADKVVPITYEFAEEVLGLKPVE